MAEKKSTNITWHHGNVSKGDWEPILKQSGATLWFTGLSGSGKSTIACEMELALLEIGHHAYLLDGDNIRHGLNKDLGFSPEDRTENIRRISEVANLFCEANILTLTAFISPYRQDRDSARRVHKKGTFIEIFVKCPLSVCETRDTKGLYKKARAGNIKDFTGISAPYEEPLNPEITIDTSKLSLDESVRTILSYLEDNGYIK
jgi:adenylylsulfate kinase